MLFYLSKHLQSDQMVSVPYLQLLLYAFFLPLSYLSSSYISLYMIALSFVERPLNQFSFLFEIILHIQALIVIGGSLLYFHLYIIASKVFTDKAFSSI